MLVIKKVSEELREMLYEAKERANLSLEYKEEYPELASCLYSMSNDTLNQAEKLHEHLVKIIKDIDVEVPESMKTLWDFEHKLFIENYEKVKLKLSMYNKM